MPIDTVLLDLDDTLVVEVASADAAIHRACALAASRYPVHPDRLHDSVRRVARERWHAGPDHAYAASIAISSWEALWARFEGDHPSLVRLRNAAPAYRRAVWSGALAAHGIADDELAEAMALTFIETRRSLHIVYDDVLTILAWLQPRYRLGLVTNGLACLQREKLRGAGLASSFDVVVTAGDAGCAKPDPAIFRARVGASRIHSGARGDGGQQPALGHHRRRRLWVADSLAQPPVRPARGWHPARRRDREPPRTPRAPGRLTEPLRRRHNRLDRPLRRHEVNR